MKKTTIIVLVILGVLALWGFSSYNGLITSQQQYTAQWAQVENQFQRRFDLIPNLEASVKGVLNQENEVFTALAEARTRYSGATTQADKVAAAGQVETSLGRLIAIVENYPQLRSVEAVQNLMVELAGTENRVAVERQKYNTTIQDYNLKVMRFPGMIFAKIFGFQAQPYFEGAAGSDVAPKVNL